MNKRKAKGILAATALTMMAMTSMTSMAAEHQYDGQTRLDVQVVKDSTNGTITYDITVPTVLTAAVDATRDDMRPNVILSTTEGSGTSDKKNVGFLTFKNHSTMTKDGTTKQIGVRLKCAEIRKAGDRKWTLAKEGTIPKVSHQMLLKFGEESKIVPQNGKAFFNDFILESNENRPMKVLAEVGGTGKDYSEGDKAAAFYIEWTFDALSVPEVANAVN